MPDPAVSPATSETPDAPLHLARRSALLLPLLALTGCGFLDNLFGDTKKHLPGTREDVLPVNEGLEAPHGEHPQVVLPAPVARDWPMAGADPSHVAGNAALPDAFRQVWASDIGVGSAYRHQVTSTPVVVGDTIWTMDSSATVSAFRIDDGRRLWTTRTKPKKSRTTNIGGGIGYSDGTIYAGTGYGELLALDAQTGEIRWRVTLDTPARSAPTLVTTSVGPTIFLVTVDQVLLALSAKDGHQIWNYDGSPVQTTLLGQGAPAYGGGIVVTGFGSGDVVAIRGDSGAVAWTDSIAAASGEVGVAEISAITAMPVIMGEIALLIGSGGLLVAVDLRAGRRLWEREVSGVQSPVAAGEFVFVTTADQQLAAIRVRTGEAAWLTQLPGFKRPKTKGAPIIWTGPVLAGGQLIYGGTRNDLILVDAVTGAITRTITMPDSITVPPIAANGTLYVITDDGLLRAFR